MIPNREISLRNIVVPLRRSRGSEGVERWVNRSPLGDFRPTNEYHALLRRCLICIITSNVNSYYFFVFNYYCFTDKSCKVHLVIN